MGNITIIKKSEAIRIWTNAQNGMDENGVKRGRMYNPFPFAARCMILAFGRRAFSDYMQSETTDAAKFFKDFPEK